jgi:hypothetical protein
MKAGNFRQRLRKPEMAKEEDNFGISLNFLLSPCCVALLYDKFAIRQSAIVNRQTRNDTRETRRPRLRSVS